MCRNYFWRRPYDLIDIFNYFKNGSNQLNTMMFQFQAGCSNSHSLEVRPTCDKDADRPQQKQCKKPGND